MPAIVERSLSTKRILYLVTITCLFFFGTLLLAINNRVLLDELISVVIFSVSFWGIFILYLMRRRLEGQLNFSGTSYKRILIYLAICWIFVLLAMVIPEFLFPVGFMIFFMATYFDADMLFGLGLYFLTVICLTCGRGTYTIYSYTLLLSVNVFLALYIRTLKKERRVLRLCGCLLAVVYNSFIPGMFYYFTYSKLDSKITSINLGLGVLLFVFSFFFMPMLYEFNQKEEYASYETILEDDYELVADLRRFSKAEYNHARKVSYLSEICATQIGCDEKVCACGGMYYRLGKLLGKPEIENAVREAVNRCFPPAVIAIIQESGAKKRLPQTPESAIVHMVDALVTKIEVLDSDTMSSEWNQEMMIYTTLNDFSNEGIYDEAKLSMNQFLLIREVLAHQNIGDFK